MCLNSTEVPYSLVNKGGQHEYVLVQYRLITQSVCLCIQCMNDGTTPTVYTEKNYDCVCIIGSVVLMGHLLKIIAFPFLLHHCYDRGQYRPFWLSATFLFIFFCCFSDGTYKCISKKELNCSGLSFVRVSRAHCFIYMHGTNSSKNVIHF